MKAEPRFVPVLLCFVLSGFAALLYETAWTREFAFVFGTSELAVVTVLSAYMGGLACGAGVAARWAGRVRRPVLVYAVLELGIALCALAIPHAIRATTALYVWSFGSLAAPGQAGGAATALFHLGASFAILLVPTGLMGATLPLLAGYAVRRDEEIGQRVGALYAANTAGAIAGTLCAAFVLLPALGLRWTVYCGAAVNALVFALAAWIARGAEVPRAPEARQAPDPAGGRRWVLPLIGLSGATSFAYEVLWTRLLGHLLGGSVYAFATMLSAFLLGIAAGSAAASRRARDARSSMAGFAVAQLGIAGLSVAAFAALDALPGLALRLGAGGQAGPGPNAALAVAVLTPGAVCIGATFPLAVRAAAGGAGAAAGASGAVMAWNTLGAIAGAVAAGFVLLPTLGFAGTLVAAALLNLCLAAAASLAAPRARRALLPVAAAAAVALALFPPSAPWQLLRSSPLGSAPLPGEARFFAVGRSATVLLIERGHEWHLTTNGLPEATIEAPAPRPGRLLQARWLGLLPGLARPDARSLLVVGLGGGVALEGVTASFASIDVVELEEEVVRANRAIGPERSVDPLADPRVRIWVNDARSALLLSDRRWDAVVSQPSHPWTAGASHLYTREFFDLVRRHLAPDGVFVQWIDVGLLDPALLGSIVATLADVFPNVRVYHPIPTALYFLASDAALDLEAVAARALAAAPDVVARRGVRTVEDVAAALVLDEDGARRFAAGAHVNTDDDNELAARSVRLGPHALRPAGVRRLLRPYDPLLVERPGVDPLRLVRRLLAVDPARATRVALAQGRPAVRETALGWIALAHARDEAAADHFARAAEADPAVQEAHFGRLAALRYGAKPLEAAAPPSHALDGPAAAVVQGWRLAAAGRWEALRRLDGELSQAEPGEASYADALRLRARWRIESGDAVAAREALALLDPMLPRAARPADFVLRARAAAGAGEPVELLTSLGELARRTRVARPGTREAAREGLDLLAALPPGAPRAGVPRLRAALRAAAGRSD